MKVLTTTQKNRLALDKRGRLQQSLGNMLTVPFYATLGVVLSLLLLDVSSAYFDTNEAIQKRMNEGVLPSKDDILISRLVGQDGTDSLTSVSAAALDFTKNFIESWNSFKSPAMNMTRSTAIQGGTQGPNALSPDLDKINAIVSAFSSKALATTARLSKLHNDKENRELTSPPPFTCETLPLTYSPDLVCSGVVDYPFLVPYGSTADDLDQAARLIAKAALPLLSTSCLSDMKRLLCSRLYLRCVDNGMNHLHMIHTLTQTYTHTYTYIHVYTIINYPKHII